jgi:nucleotide-binding universal stress UspA family protein
MVPTGNAERFMKTKQTKFTEVRSKRRFAHILAASPTAPRSQIQSILVPSDFSEPSKAALQYAMRLAEQFGAKLALLHVVEPVGTPDFAYYPLMMENDKVMAKAKEELNEVAARNGLNSKLIGKTLVRHGTAFHEIAQAAALLKVDLIVIATHGYKGLKHVLLGSTTERVVRHAPCPVLVVRNRER